MVSRNYTPLVESRRLSLNTYGFLRQIRLSQGEVRRVTRPSRISMNRLGEILQDFEPTKSP